MTKRKGFNRRESLQRQRIAAAVLSEADVAYIKRRLLEGATLMEMAVETRMGYGTIANISSGRSWRWVAPEQLDEHGEPLPLINDADVRPPALSGQALDRIAAEVATSAASEVPQLTRQMFERMPEHVRKLLIERQGIDPATLPHEPSTP